MITINSQLDMTPGAIPVVIHRSQYDSDFSIVFTLFARTGDFTIASGTTAKVRGTKKSGTGYSADATIDVSAKTVTVTGDQQMTVASGQNIFEIVLLNGTSELCSANFILDVERAALDMDTITDDTMARELDNLDQFVTEAEAAAVRAETAAATFDVDATLTVSGKAADAKAAMDNILRRTEVMPINPGLSIKSVEGTTVTLTQRSVFYIRNIGASGPAYQSRDAQTEIVLEHNNVLVYNNDTRLLEVVPSSAVLPGKYTTLLWNQMGYLKGLWEPYYLLALFDKYKSDTLQPHFNQQKSSRIMNRQGQGYDYPENSKEGILSAMEDGYRNIRISVAATSDNVIVCNHAYELAHASTSVAFKLDGESYTTDTNINEVTADFISRITYKGYGIPTLRSVLDDIMKYDTKITLELKGTYTTESATELLNIIHYYNLDYVISGMANSTQIDVFTAIRQDLNLAVILRYSDNEARNYITKYKNVCKSLRLDCYWTDTIPEASLANIIHPDYKIKLGGSEVTSAQVHAALPWCDACECALKLSEL